jgi:hypothetical protein
MMLFLFSGSDLAARFVCVRAADEAMLRQNTARFAA